MTDKIPTLSKSSLTCDVFWEVDKLITE